MGISLTKIPTTKTRFRTLLADKAQDTALRLTSSDFRKSKKYLKLQKKQLIRDKQNPNLIEMYNTLRLEGIQKGIKVFQGMSMQGIALVAENLSQMPLTRGCRNLCSHCYLSAQTPVKKTADTINTIDFEDFKQFNEGFKRLNKRLGFNIFEGNKKSHVAFFYDGDPSNVKMLDKKGKAHNSAEAMEIFHTNFRRPLLFDTAGWHKGDNWAKQNAKDIVTLYKKDPKAFDECNISINPFHSIMETSYKLKTKGADTKAQKLRDIYTERMANTLAIFAPIYNKGASIIERCAGKTAKESPYSDASFSKIKEEIFIKLKEKSNDENLTFIERMLNGNRGSLLVAEDPAISIGGRSKRFFPQETQTKYQNEVQKIINDTKQTGHMKTKDVILDINGKVYIETDGNVLVPTEHQFNFINKDKKTAPFSNHIDKILNSD